ncbi:MAG: hypothetical protein RIQ52_876 [Pseudomonadota bacterium]|jgi:tRNA modification GTPase
MASTIAAIATPPGTGGVGVIRISGPYAADIGQRISGRQNLLPRYAHFAHFYDRHQTVIDSGLLIHFPAPASYTGEDVIEIQAHGNALLLDMLLERILELGAVPAEAGEFTRRAYLNEKIDLVQAEAIADLINSQTRLSAMAAQRSLQGRFSAYVDELLQAMIRIRVHIEAALDFSDEDIDFVSEHWVGESLHSILQRLDVLSLNAHQGQRLRDGLHLVLTGKPNSGKSTLLNALSGRNSAIVSDEAGTTRDVIREHIEIKGIPLTISDTAGLRASDNAIEQEGQQRARQALTQADHILVIGTAGAPGDLDELLQELPEGIPATIVLNKIDQQPDLMPAIGSYRGHTTISLSAREGHGLPLLLERLTGSQHAPLETPGLFSARRRHLHALDRVKNHILDAISNWEHAQGDLVAEDLRQAQYAMDSITGKFSSDDLLGEIFSALCIGK